MKLNLFEFTSRTVSLKITGAQDNVMNEKLLVKVKIPSTLEQYYSKFQLIKISYERYAHAGNYPRFQANITKHYKLYAAKNSSQKTQDLH